VGERAKAAANGWNTSKDLSKTAIERRFFKRTARVSNGNEIIHARAEVLIEQSRFESAAGFACHDAKSLAQIDIAASDLRRIS